jgi:hypothetical protein
LEAIDLSGWSIKLINSASIAWHASSEVAPTTGWSHGR